VWQVLPSPDESQNQLSERDKTIVNNKPAARFLECHGAFYAAFPARAGAGLGRQTLAEKTLFGGRVRNGTSIARRSAHSYG